MSCVLNSAFPGGRWHHVLMTATDISTSTSTAQHIEATERYAAHNYHPLPVVLAEGHGAWVIDVDGRRYLDCLAGYSALNFGHSNERLVAVAREQLGRLTLPAAPSSTTSSAASRRRWPASPART